MTMRLAAPLPATLAVALALAGCGSEAPEPAATQTPTRIVTAPPPALDPAAFPALGSRSCRDVVQFYFEAIGAHEFDKAALAWFEDGPAGALEELYGAYREPQFTWGEPRIEGAAGSSYCTIEARLTDAQDPARAPVDNTIELRRVNDVPGATPRELRWTIHANSMRDRGGSPGSR